MFTRIFRLRTQLTQAYDSSSSLVKSKLANVEAAVNKIELPERYKGGVVEKWANYWKNLCRDYYEVAEGVVQQTKDRPIRAAFYGLTGAATYYCAKHNPTQSDFLEQFRKHNMNLVLVHESCQKPETTQFFKFIERAHNQGLLRTLNLGVLTLLWVHDYDEALGVYKAICTYTQPDYLNFHQRVVDVGFLDKWWKLEKVMIDYDVNENNL